VQRAFSAEWLPQLIEALPVGVFILDAAGTAVYANWAAQELLGRAIADGDHVENLRDRYAAYIAGTDEPYPTSRMPIVRALAGEHAHVDDMEIDRDGVRVAIDVTATPMFDMQHRVAFAVAIFQDITAKKKEQALRAKSAFLMNISHELRTPLNHIIGFTDLLAERVTDERSRKLANIVRTSGLELLGKINDLIELARSSGDSPSPRAIDESRAGDPGGA
jgi:PAS domain S-box-containing protein